MIGIDEAGYGPNLGPLVMTAVACQVPAEHFGSDDDDGPNLWRLLDTVVRDTAADDVRLFIADSKQVYSPTGGLAELERAVLACMLTAGDVESGGLRPPHLPLTGYLERICATARDELGEEPWFRGATFLPVQASWNDIQDGCGRLAGRCREQGLRFACIQSLVVCPGRFNAMLERWDSKGAILGEGLMEFLRRHHDPDDGEDAVLFFVDKHGGRNYYAAMVQHALEEGFVLAREEGPLRSVYDVIGLRRPVRAVFEPRADGNHLCVALASMFSKYLREVLMLEFNRFWSEHVPGLKPTAGYPGDSRRFYQAIRPAVARLGIGKKSLWRER